MTHSEKSRVNVTFYGGVGEIGGNKFLVKDADTRIFLDFGMGFSERRKFYLEPWLPPKDERGLLEFSMLPEIDGV
jgi:ribonuclease J